MGQIRNDSLNNLLCSLTIAGHFVIPEVIVVFDNKILRGNRTTKTSASNFNSFKSPNFIPLGHLNLKINIHWQLVHHCKKDQNTKFVPLQCQVQTMKITPLSTPTIPKSKYIVLQSLGTGNIPTQGPYSQWLKSNSKLKPEEQKTIVNISQVYQSMILNIYATGNQAVKLGLIPGGDMTCQAAMTKLSYLASKGYEGEKLKEMMTTNLRQQLTESKDRLVTTKTNYVLRSLTILEKTFSRQSAQYQNLLKQIVFPLLVAHRVSKSVIDRLKQQQFDINYVYPDGGNILHYYMKIKSVNDEDDLFLKFLMASQVNAQLIDNHGNSALFYALQLQKYKEAELIKQYGGILKTTNKRIFKAIRNQQLTLLHALSKFGDTFDYVNQQGRNCITLAVIYNKKEVFHFFTDFTDLLSEQKNKQKDIYDNNCEYYMNKYHFSAE